MHIGSGTDLEHLSQVGEALEKVAMEVGRTITTIALGGGCQFLIAKVRPMSIWTNTSPFGMPLESDLSPSLGMPFN